MNQQIEKLIIKKNALFMLGHHFYLIKTSL